MSVNGISGMSSGIDVDSLVKQSMQVKQNQYDSMYKQEKKAEWTKDAYNSWYNKLADFQNNTLYKYSLSSGMDPRTASSSDSNIVTAKAGGAAANMSHRVAVEELSSNAYLKSVSKIDRNAGASDSIKLSDVIGISNVKLTAATGNTSNQDRLEFDIGANHYILNGSEMDETALSFTIKDGSTTKDIDTGIESPTSAKVSFSYRDLAEGTLNDLAAKINNGGTNISANYDTVNDSFSIYNNKGGASNQINITVDNVALSQALQDKGINTTSDTQTRALLGNLKLGQYDTTTDELKTPVAGDFFLSTDAPADSNKIFTGTAGKIKVDGKEYSTDSSQIAIDGITYSLLSTSDFTVDPSDSTKKIYKNTIVSVNTDTDTIVKNVKQFVDDYNKMLQDLKDSVYTEPDSNYQPLTDDEKKAMSDDQVKDWTDKAKKGLLYKDDSLTTLIDSMRSAVNQPIAGIGGKYNSLNNIGVSVSADWSQDNAGVLSLDEDKLRTALNDDPDAAYKIFVNPASSDDNSSSFGVVKKLNNAVSAAVGKGDIATANGIRGMAGTSDSSNVSDQSYWGNLIADWNKKMSAFQDDMDKYQDQLYKQYDDMETAISNMSSQYSYITSYLG